MSGTVTIYCHIVAAAQFSGTAERPGSQRRSEKEGKDCGKKQNDKYDQNGFSLDLYGGVTEPAKQIKDDERENNKYHRPVGKKRRFKNTCQQKRQRDDFSRNPQGEKSIEVDMATANVSMSPVEITETISPRQKSTATL